MKIEDQDEVTFNIEGSEKSVALFAMYAGLRMYHDHKSKANTDDRFSVAAAEAYCLLEQLKEQFPEQYKECEEEYHEVYVDPSLKAGAKVVMINCIEADVYDGRVWTVHSDSTVDKGEHLVFLTGFPGKFLVKNLIKS